MRHWRKYLFVFSSNAGKYKPEKLRIRILFTQCLLQSGVILYTFQARIPFLYPLKTLENFRFSTILWRHGNETLV